MAYTPLASMIKQLQEQGHDEVTSKKIATSHLQKVGVLEPGTMKMTEFGRQRHRLEWNARKISRRAKSGSRPERHYFVDMDGNVKVHPSFKHLKQ